MGRHSWKIRTQRAANWNLQFCNFCCGISLFLGHQHHLQGNKIKFGTLWHIALMYIHFSCSKFSTIWKVLLLFWEPCSILSSAQALPIYKHHLFNKIFALCCFSPLVDEPWYCDIRETHWKQTRGGGSRKSSFHWLLVLQSTTPYKYMWRPQTPSQVYN